MKRYLCYILLQILCICLLLTKGQSTNADVVECNKTNTPSYSSSYTYQAFSPIDIQASAVNGSLGGVYANDYLYDKKYRLIQSDCNGGFAYSFKASYSPAGRMGSKSMIANNLVGNLRFGSTGSLLLINHERYTTRQKVRWSAIGMPMVIYLR